MPDGRRRRRRRRCVAFLLEDKSRDAVKRNQRISEAAIRLGPRAEEMSLKTD